MKYQIKADKERIILERFNFMVSTILPEILSRVEEQTFPASSAQQQIWMLDQLMPESALNIFCVTVHLRQTLNTQMLAQSLNALLQRHDALRTIFQAPKGQLVQVIVPNLTIPLSVVDLRVLLAEEREAEAQRLASEEARRPFDLSQGPLVRAKLLQLGNEEHALLLSVHRSICDSRSLGLLLRELADLYESFSSNQPSPLPELPLSYAEFAQWQQVWLQGDTAAEQLAYWKLQLAGCPDGLNLPTDRPRLPVPTWQGSTHSLALSGTLSEVLRELSRQEGVSLEMILLAALQSLLYRYSGQEDLVIGTIAAGRKREGCETAIGLFENMLALRTSLAGDLPFRELLGRVRKVILEAQTHQELPFEYLVKELYPTRPLDQNPFLQVALTLSPPPPSLPPRWILSQMEIDAGSSRFDLSLEIEERAEDLQATFTYNCDLFDDTTIARLAGHWQRLLEGIVADPMQPIASLPLLTEQERHQLLVEWNTPPEEYFQGRCVHELFEEQVERTLEAMAVVCEDRRLTYDELNQRANQLAHHLRQLGIQPEVPVGICLERSLEVVVALLGIFKAGGVYVPMDPSYPAERIAFMVQDTGMPVLLTQQHLLPQFPESHPQLVCLDTDWSTVSQQPTTNPAHLVKGEHLAYIIYTSGSTGRPKGVLIEHHALAAHCEAIVQAQELSANDCLLQLNSFTFDASLEQILPPLLTGARLVLRGPEIWSPTDLLHKVKEQQVTIIMGSCDYWHEVMSQWATVPEQLSGQQLRLVSVGGDRLSPEAVQLWRQSPLRSGQLFNVYGPTEATIATTIFDIPRHIEQEQLETSIPIGRPLPNRTIYILDKVGQPVPQGVTGELHIGGKLLARGYLNNPEQTAQRFIADPFSQQPQARLYKTGDLARYLPGGIIEFLGRADHQVKIRGFRIELGEIEAAIKRHPAVHQALVVAHEDASDFKRLVAYVVPQPAQEASQLVAQLRGLLNECLPDYMIPAAFVLLEAFPVNTNGKIDRHALPVPDFTDIERQEGFVAPRTSLEEIVANIWAEVLGIKQLSIHDNFFALGGHSLLAMQVTSRLHALLHVHVPLRRFFEAPTVAQLAETVSRLQATHSQSRQPVLRKLPQETLTPEAVSPSEQAIHAFPVSLTQEGLWFLHQLEPECVTYNVYVVLRMRKPLDVRALECSLNTLVQRHDTLRTIFGTRQGKPVQLIVPTLTLALPVHDLQHLPEHEREAETLRLASAEARRPFDLTQGPLLRATLLRQAPAESLLLLTMHHIITDGWSLNVLLPELSSLYEAFASGQPLQQPDLPLQYTDFAVWQREQLERGQFAEQLAYWERQLANAPEALDLPVARPMPTQLSSQGATYHLKLPQTLTNGLKSLSRQQGVTLYMTIMAAFQILLYRYTGQKDLVIGTVAANRQAATEALVGFFVNTLVLRTDLSGDPSFIALLVRVREVVLAAQAYQELPFASLVKTIRPDRQAGRNPLFQVMMSFDTPLASLPEGWEPVDLGNLTATAHFELSLEVREGPQDLDCYFEYSTDLFDQATIALMAGHWQRLLEGIVADPTRNLSELPLLTEKELHQILVEWNSTQIPYPKDICVHQLFEAQVERTPQAVAVIFEDQQMTYRELNQRANQLAHHLQHLGVGPEVLVGVCLERSLDIIVGLLGILKAGGAYVPLDPGFPSERIAFILEDTQAPVVVTQECLVEKLPECHPQLVCLDSDWPAIRQQSEANPINEVKREQLAYVMYTSGSTGQPKGVLIEHQALAAHCWAIMQVYELRAEDCVLQFAAFTFDVSLEQILPTLLVGARLVVRGQEIWSPADLLYKVKDLRLTVINLSPSYCHHVLQEWVQVPEQLLDHQLRLVVVGGDRLLPKMLELWWQTPLRSVRLLNAYGPTETTITATIFDVRGDHREQLLEQVPIGRPLPHRTVYILDSDGNPVPAGVTGELYIGGNLLARGYLHRPELTTERFIPDCFCQQPQARLYKTGDLVRYQPDGTIEFLGRLDHQVKIRGFRIELGEIEVALSQHPAVRLAVVMAREDMPGDKRLVAYVELQKEQSTTAAELKSHLTKQLPAYMVPSAFVLLEKLPLTPNGKVDRRALPVPESGRSVIDDSYVAPRLPLEQQLVEIWEELLGTRPIGIKDDFFDLGGDSLLAVQLFDRMAQVCNKKLPLSILFAEATIEHLARALVGESKAALPGKTKTDGRASVVAVQTGGSRQPFFYLHGEWKGGGLYSRELARTLGPDQPFYLLEPYKFDGLTLPPTFEEMAAAHLEAMRSIQAEGPYFLSGYCNGALLAYEIARQLHAQGQTVGLLLLMDSDFPARNRLVRSAISHFGNLLQIGQEKQFEWFLSLQHVYRYLRFTHYRSSTNAKLLESGEQGKPSKASLPTLNLRLKALLPKIETLRQDWSNIYDWLVSNYTPSLYPGKITFFWTSEEPSRSDGWQKVVKAKKGEVEIYINPGNHISGRTEYLPVLAERLRMCLNKAQATLSSQVDG